MIVKKNCVIYCTQHVHSFACVMLILLYTVSLFIVEVSIFQIVKKWFILTKKYSNK